MAKRKSNINKEDRQTVSIRMTKELIEKIDNYGDKFNLTRSATINLLVSAQLQQDEMVEKLPKILEKLTEEK